MKEQKVYKSLISIPVKVEMQEVQHTSDKVLSVEDLALQIDEARKGKARVDSKYVDYANRGHLYEYKFDYARFLDNISYIIKATKNSQ